MLFCNFSIPAADHLENSGIFWVLSGNFSQFAIIKMDIEIVDLPFFEMLIFHSHVNVNQRVYFWMIP